MIKTQYRAPTRQRSNFKFLDCGTSILKKSVYYFIRSEGFQAPHYPNDYECTYTLRPEDPLDTLRLTFAAFKLQDSCKCTADFLEVSGFRRFCGSISFSPPPIFWKSQLSMLFKTDHQVTDKGFSLLVLVAPPGAGQGGLPCGETSLARRNYTILSQNFPSRYDPTLYCKWQLTADTPTDQLSLSCSSFDTARDSRYGCSFEGMRVNGKTYCGTTAPSVTATGNITAEFYAAYGSGETHNGFNCTVTVEAGTDGNIQPVLNEPYLTGIFDSAEDTAS